MADIDRFLDADAPMTAKCILRDKAQNLVGKEPYVEGWVADVIEEMKSYGYGIRSIPTETTTRKRRRLKTR